MKYTLDSITLVESVLQKKYPDQQIDVTPILLNGSQNAYLYGKKSSDTLFFGVLTIGNNCECLIGFDDKTNMLIDTNSSIEMLFTSAIFKKIDVANVENFSYQFMGYRIQIDGIKDFEEVDLSGADLDVVWIEDLNL